MTIIGGGGCRFTTDICTFHEPKIQLCIACTQHPQHWRSQGFSTSGPKRGRDMEGRESFENSCMRMAFFMHIECN